MCNVLPCFELGAWKATQRDAIGQILKRLILKGECIHFDETCSLAKNKLQICVAGALFTMKVELDILN